MTHGNAEIACLSTVEGQLEALGFIIIENDAGVVSDAWKMPSKTGFYETKTYRRNNETSHDVFTVKAFKLSANVLIFYFQKISEQFMFEDSGLSENEEELESFSLSLENCDRNRDALSDLVFNQLNKILAKLFKPVDEINISMMGKDLRLQIISYLPIKDIVSCFSVCNDFNSISKLNFFWRDLIKRDHKEDTTYSALLTQARRPTITDFNARSVFIGLFKSHRESKKVEFSFYRRNTRRVTRVTRLMPPLQPLRRFHFTRPQLPFSLETLNADMMRVRSVGALEMEIMTDFSSDTSDDDRFSEF